MHRVHIAGTTHPFQSFFQDNNQEAAWGNDTANGEDQVHGRYVHTVCGIVEVCTYITIYRGSGKICGFRLHRVVSGVVFDHPRRFMHTQITYCCSCVCVRNNVMYISSEYLGLCVIAYVVRCYYYRSRG